MTAILSLLAGMMAPSMNRAYRSLELRGAVQEFNATLNAAAELSIRERIQTRIAFEQDGDSFWVEKDDLTNSKQQLKAVSGGPLGEPRYLPKGMKINLESTQDASQQGSRYVTFSPDGSRTPSIVRLTDRREHKRWIDTGRSLGGTKILTEKPADAAP